MSLLWDSAAWDDPAWADEPTSDSTGEVESIVTELHDNLSALPAHLQLAAVHAILEVLAEITSPYRAEDAS